MRTTNMIEKTNKELKKEYLREAFHYQESVLRLAVSILIDIYED